MKIESKNKIENFIQSLKDNKKALNLIFLNFKHLLKGDIDTFNKEKFKVNKNLETAQIIYRQYLNLVEMTESNLKVMLNNEAKMFVDDPVYQISNSIQKEDIINRRMSESEYWAIVFDKVINDFNDTEHTFFIKIGILLNICKTNTNGEIEIFQDIVDSDIMEEDTTDYHMLSQNEIYNLIKAKIMVLVADDPSTIVAICKEFFDFKVYRKIIEDNFGELKGKILRS